MVFSRLDHVWGTHKARERRLTLDALHMERMRWTISLLLVSWGSAFTQIQKAQPKKVIQYHFLVKMICRKV